MIYRHYGKGIYRDDEINGPQFCAEILAEGTHFVLGYYRTDEKARGAYKRALKDILDAHNEVKGVKRISTRVYLRKGYGWQAILKYQKRKLSCGVYIAKATAERAAIEADERVREYELDWSEEITQDRLKMILAEVKAKYLDK